MRLRTIAAHVQIISEVVLVLTTVSLMEKPLGAQAHDEQVAARPGSGNTNDRTRLCNSVVRKHHRFRHWLWSGIPPFEGGFIPDPHYLCSENATFSEPASAALSDKESEYVIIDVNPFFNDKSSEILLLIRSRGVVYEYSLQFPKHKDVRAVLAQPEPPPAKVYPYENGLAVLANFSGPAKGTYILPLPLRSKTTLELVPAGTAQFKEIAAAFRSVGLEPTTKRQFCESTNDFRAFYEKYLGPCYGPERVVSEIEKDFARFWLGN